MSETVADDDRPKGFLGFVERAGNKLPDPVFIFFFLILVLMVISVIASVTGLSAQLGDQVLAGMSDSSKARFSIGSDGVIPAKSLLSPQNIERLWVEMPATFTHFHPLGYVLVVMLGAGVAERTGLFGDAMRAAVRGAPKFLLTPVVAFVAMAGNHAADAAYVVLIPLAGILFASAGRHPVAGIAAAFAGVSGGFSANFAPGQLDALLYGITEAAGEILVPEYNANIAGNWYFITAMMVAFIPVIWFVTDKIVEPRLGSWNGADTSDSSDLDEADKPLSADQKKGLMWAGICVLAVFLLWTFMTIGPGTPLYITDAEYIAQGMSIEEAASKQWFERCSPLFQSLVAAFLILFLSAGVAYGICAKTIKSGDDLVGMMADAMKDMGYYLVLAFAAAHFVAMFGWSNLGLISAVHGASAIDGTVHWPHQSVRGVCQCEMGVACTGHGAHADASWRVTRWRDRGLSCGRLGNQYHHAAHGLFPAHPHLCSALEEGFRYRVSDGHHDPIFDLDHGCWSDPDDYLGGARPAIRARRSGELRPAGWRRIVQSNKNPGEMPGFFLYRVTSCINSGLMLW